SIVSGAIVTAAFAQSLSSNNAQTKPRYLPEYTASGDLVLPKNFHDCRDCREYSRSAGGQKSNVYDSNCVLDGYRPGQARPSRQLQPSRRQCHWRELPHGCNGDKATGAAARTPSYLRSAICACWVISRKPDIEPTSPNGRV